MTAKGDDDRPMFWMAEWGAPFEVYCRTMQIVRTFADADQDHVSRSSACDGLSTWPRRAVMGEYVDNAVVRPPLPGRHPVHQRRPGHRLQPQPRRRGVGMTCARLTCFVTQALGLPPNEVEGPYLGASPLGRFIDNL